jgi:uncharacterized membrane protein
MSGRRPGRRCGVFTEVIGWLALGTGAAGVAVIVWGVVVSALAFIVQEYRRMRGANVCRERTELRHHLGSYLLLGLEVLVAADVVHTILKPTLEEMAILGSIVAIRTVLNVFLNMEMREHRCGAAAGGAV